MCPTLGLTLFPTGSWHQLFSAPSLPHFFLIHVTSSLGCKATAASSRLPSTYFLLCSCTGASCRLCCLKDFHSSVPVLWGKHPNSCSPFVASRDQISARDLLKTCRPWVPPQTHQIRKTHFLSCRIPESSSWVPVAYRMRNKHKSRVCSGLAFMGPVFLIRYLAL